MKRFPSGLFFATLCLLTPMTPRAFADESADQLADQTLGADSDQQDQTASQLAKQNGVAIKPGKDAEESAAELADQNGVDATPGDDESASQLAKQNGVAIKPGVDGEQSANKLAEQEGLAKHSKKVSDPAASVFAGGPGVDGSIYAVVALPDGSAVIGGRFTSVNGQPRSNLAHVNADGSLDSKAMLGAPTDGVSGGVYALALDASGNLLVGGFFTAAQGAPVQNFARYLASGKMDRTFNGGQTPNGPVYAISVQADGKIVVGGQFSMVGDQPRRNLARFNADSTLDGAVAAANGSSGSVRSLAALGNGAVIVGGTFEIPGQTVRNILSVGAE